MKLYNHVVDFEMPTLSFFSIFTICCSSRRKFERYERIIQQEKDKNIYLKMELKATKQLLIESYADLLLHEQQILKEVLWAYETSQKQYEKVKELKATNNLDELQAYMFIDESVDGSVDDVEDDWKKIVDLHYAKLEKQMKVFEDVEMKLKIARLHGFSASE